jgi:anti-sigma B factor antagonist
MVKLNLEICVHGSVTVVYCRGRIAYREEAAALSERVAELLPRSRCLVLELSGVEMIDSAGLGELAGIHLGARAAGCSFKLVAPRKHVRNMLELTNLASVLEIHSSLEAAVPGADSWPGHPAVAKESEVGAWEEFSQVRE